MKNVAFITLYTIGGNDELGNGWINGLDGRRALVDQNSHRGSFDDGTIWKQIGNTPELDHVVIHVPCEDLSERSIELAARLPASKLTIITCACNLPGKTSLFQRVMTEAKWLLCECRGHRTMERLYKSFMETGELSDSGK